MDTLELSHITGGIMKCCSRFTKQFLKKWNNRVTEWCSSFTAAFTACCICIYCCIPHFTAVYTQEKWNSVYPKYTVLTALFIIAKKWKQPKSPATEEWIIKIMVCPYNRIILSNTKEWRTTETSFYMDKPWKDANWKKIVTKHILLRFQLYEVSRIGKSIETVN